MLSIIVLCRNRLEYTKKTISNLITNTTVRHEFIFVDNNSTSSTRLYLRSLKGKTNAKRELLIFNKYNYGVPGGRNSGMIHALGKYIMTIDNDILVPPGYDKDLITACDSIKELGMIGVSVEKDDYPIVNKNGVSIQFKSGNIGGACICLPRKVFNKVGYYSADFIYGGEDCDMYIRMRCLGLINGYILNKGIHLGINDTNNVYKKDAHRSDSKQALKVSKNMRKYIKKNSVYVPFSIPVKFNSDGSRKWS
jgi:GT2 family glycosyltransferase